MTARLALVYSVWLSTSAFAVTIESNPGESAPGNSATPNPATPLDVIQFSLNADSQTYGNACGQQSAFDGLLALEVDHSDRVVDVMSVEPAPNACFLIYAPVTGIRGEVDSLSPGDWFIQDSFGNAVSVNVLREGDANKDGRFDSSDFIQIYQAAEYEDAIAQNSTWEEGDWTGDKEFTSSDLVAAFQANGNQFQGVTQVPEPSTRLLAIVAAGLVSMAIRRKNVRRTLGQA